MINGGLRDGFGDDLSLSEQAALDDLVTERITERQRLIEIQASERCTDPSMWADMVQEGRIAVWQVVSKRPDAPGAYINAAVRNTVGNVATGGKMTGEDTKRGHPIDPLRRRERDSFDDLDWSADLAVPEALDEVLMGYHHGQILKAISLLPESDQKYVLLRFWGGLTNVEIAAKYGLTAGYLSDRWVGHTKPLLARRLAHLSA